VTHLPHAVCARSSGNVRDRFQLAVVIQVDRWRIIGARRILIRALGQVAGVIRLEDILTRFTNARESREVGAVFASAVQSEGYENVVLARLGSDARLEVPWQWLPDAFAETYFGEGWQHRDPVLSEVLRRRLPFGWDEPELTHRLDAGQTRMMAGAMAAGVHSGFTIPFHGFGSSCDLLSISQRGRRQRLPEQRRALIATVGLRALMRFLELQQDASSSAGLRNSLQYDVPQLDDPLLADAASPFVLPYRHLRALVLVEAGERRWRIGLTQLGRQIYLKRKTAELADLERWGLIVDVPDDWRWLYYLAPSPLGRAFLSANPHVAPLRARIRASEIDRRETPDEMAEE
jgi:hypothetical protein